MATRTPSDAGLQSFGNNARTVIWTGLLNGDDGTPFEMPGWADRSVQVLGTFGVGGTLLIEGSNEVTPTNWHTLNDPSSTALSITAAKIKTILEVTRWVRPRVSAGDGTTTLTVNMIVRKPS